jgi:hypothetical protein
MAQTVRRGGSLMGSWDISVKSPFAPACGGKLPSFSAYFAGVARKTLAPSAPHTSTA